MAAQIYEYQSLSKSPNYNIRLLHLKPYSDSDQIQADIVEVPIDSSLQYTALSYVWGEEAPTSKLYINDRMLKIRPNLSDALQRLRKQGVLKIWADAVCINQADDQERADQVKIMCKIYECAEKVIFYLHGFGNNDSQKLDFILNSLNWFCYRAHRTHLEKGTPLPLPLDWDNLSGYGLPELSDNRWKSVVQFLEHPWFGRVWVIQESVVAKTGTFFYGDDGQIDDQALYRILDTLRGYSRFLNALGQTPWLHFSPMRRAIQRCYDTSSMQSGVFQMVGMKVFGNAQWRPAKLINLLRHTYTATASDERDYVFSLIGISHDADTADLQPSYKEEKEQIYVRVAAYLITTNFGPELFHHLHGVRKNLPSWVPDWSRIENGVFASSSGGAGIGVGYSAAMASAQMMKLDICEKELVVHGIFLDTIERFGNFRFIIKDAQEISDNFVFENTMACLVDTLQLLNRYERYPSGESKSEVLCRFPICDIWENKLKASKDALEQLRQFVMKFNAITSIAGARQVAETVGRPSESLWNKKPVQYAAQAFEQFSIADRCCTRGGYLCHVPRQAKVGDIVVLIGGCDVPYLLRPREQGDKYSFIGACYVHGVMFGEQWKQSLVREIRIL